MICSVEMNTLFMYFKNTPSGTVNYLCFFKKTHTDACSLKIEFDAHYSE